MKYCGTCKTNLDDSMFNKNKSKKDGMSTICRDCSKQNSKEYYKTHKDRMIPMIKDEKEKRVNIVRNKLVDYLRSHPCVDCGYSEHIAALEFDHVRGEKLFAIASKAYQGYSWEVIKSEIDKCEVRCANCHKIKTAKQFNWYSSPDNLT